MRLQDTKRVKFKPAEHQRPMQTNRGRPRTKMKDFAREGVFALRVRKPLPGDGSAWTKWRWYHPVTLTEHWWGRELMPQGKAQSLAAEMRSLQGAEVKLITVWRKPRE